MYITYVGITFSKYILKYILPHFSATLSKQQTECTYLQI